MIDDIYIDEETGPVEDMLTLNISFHDSPDNVHVGRVTVSAGRRGVAEMLRELALHIEHNVGKDLH